MGFLFHVVGVQKTEGKRLREEQKWRGSKRHAEMVDSDMMNLFYESEEARCRSQGTVGGPQYVAIEYNICFTKLVVGQPRRKQYMMVQTFGRDIF